MASLSSQQALCAGTNRGQRNKGCYSCRLRGKACSFSDVAPVGSICDTCATHNTACVGSGYNRPSNMRQGHPDFAEYMLALHEWIKDHTKRRTKVPPFPGPADFVFTALQLHNAPHSQQHASPPVVTPQEPVVLSPAHVDFSPLEEYYSLPLTPHASWAMPDSYPSMGTLPHDLAPHTHAFEASSYPDAGIFDILHLQAPNETYYTPAAPTIIAQSHHHAFPFLDPVPTFYPAPSNTPFLHPGPSTPVYTAASYPHTMPSYSPPPGPPPISSLLDSHGNRLYPYEALPQHSTNTDNHYWNGNQYHQNSFEWRQNEGPSQRAVPSSLAPPGRQRRGFRSGPLRAIIGFRFGKHKEDQASDASRDKEETRSASSNYLSPSPSPSSMCTPVPELSPSLSPSPSPVSPITPNPEPNIDVEALATSLGNLGFGHQKSHGGE